MQRLVRIFALMIVALAALWSMPPGMRAQAGNQAALVIRHGDNEVKTACVDFDEAQISGYELLQRSGFGLEIGAQGLGSLICSIDNTGCPASDCLCQCKGGGECVYWSYWHGLNDKWEYSQGGASIYKVEPGAVEGWSWGPGAVNQAVPPPAISFDDVCQVEPTNTPTSSPTATNTQPPIVISVIATSTKTISTAATATVPTITATSTSTAEPTETTRVTFTPSPFPQPPVEATIAIDNLNSPQITLSPSVVATEQPLIRSTEFEQVEVEAKVQNTPTPNMAVATATPSPVAIAVRAKTESAERFPEQEIQMPVVPTIEPTVLLAVIGAGVFPTTDPNINESDNSELDSPISSGTSLLSYIVFVVILAGLAGLLAIFSSRRKKQKP